MKRTATSIIGLTLLGSASTVGLTACGTPSCTMTGAVFAYGANPTGFVAASCNSAAGTVTIHGYQDIEGPFPYAVRAPAASGRWTAFGGTRGYERVNLFPTCLGYPYWGDGYSRVTGWVEKDGRSIAGYVGPWVNVGHCR